MIYFRIRDYLSVLTYRLLRFRFAAFGSGTRIVRPLRIVGSRHVSLGDSLTIQYGAYIAAITDLRPDPRLRVGSGTMIGNHSHIICTRSISIAENVLIADRVYISDSVHQYADVTRPVMHQPLKQLDDVVIGEGAWIGENVCIIGARVGRNSVVGANSVVTRDIPDFCVALGAPAVPVKRYCSERGAWFATDDTGSFVP
jgi:acetyltransferase-like isoleucine patch superfamily enzyme